jgi:nitrite reductase/ring-hydroxylating ferredoxin subunit
MNFDAGWYAVALSDGLQVGTSAGTRLFGKEMVIWRDAHGAAHVWEDRCPHRGMRLSFGFVRNDRIACLYHGWQYDAAGQCRGIPAHPDLQVPKTIRVATYASCECVGMVWVYSKLAVESPPDLSLDCPQVRPVRSIYIDRDPDAVLESLIAEKFPPLPSAAAVRPLVKRSGSLLFLELENNELLAAIQPFDEGKTALHLATAGRPPEGRGAGRKEIALWAQELRRHLEHPTAAAVMMRGTREMVP